MPTPDAFDLEDQDPSYSPKPMTIVLPPGQEVRIISGHELQIIVGDIAGSPARTEPPDSPPLSPSPKPDNASAPNPPAQKARSKKRPGQKRS